MDVLVVLYSKDKETSQDNQGKETSTEKYKEGTREGLQKYKKKKVPVGTTFSAPVQTGPWGPSQSPIRWVLGHFLGGKAAGAWR
jgi:hypothetical protein